MATYNLNINGQQKSVEADADTPMLWVLRDELDLKGTKFGCGVGQCRACTVHLDGAAVPSCQLPVSAIGDRAITTIEGLADAGDQGLQEAWTKHDVPQCGYCQAGQLMNAAAFLKANPNPSAEEIANATHGNICRCGTYNKIKAAIADAAKS